jgi:putative hydrolase of the HAD superfamily
MSLPISAICFDLDDTLIQYDQEPEEVLETAFRRAGIGPFCSPDELWAVASDTPAADSDHQFLTYLFREAADRYDGPIESAETLARTYEAATDHTAVSFRPGAAAALERAREHGPVGLITNGGREIQETKLRALDLSGAFDTLVYAGEQTPPKPAQEPFDRALTDLNTDPTETLYVGNSLHHDVTGAKRAGWHAAWFPREDDRGRRPGDHAPDYTFETLDELERTL